MVQKLKNKQMKLSCDEATTICDKSQYGEVTLLEKIKLSWHIFICRKCGRYSKQNVFLTKCYQKQSEIKKQEKRCLSENEKYCMENELKENR